MQRSASLALLPSLLLSWTLGCDLVQREVETLEEGFEDAAGRVVDAERYAPEIQALDAALFAEVPERPSCITALRRLASALESSGEGGLVPLYTGQLRVLAASVGPLPADVRRLRTEWLAIRGSLFDDAHWFVWESGELAHVANAGRAPVPSQVSRELLQSLDGAIRELELLIPRGRRRADELGEADIARVASEGQDPELIARWERFGADWREEIAAATATLPRALPADAPHAFETAFESTRSAIQHLHLIDSTTDEWRTPFRSQWTSELELAEAELARAAEWIGRVRSAPVGGQVSASESP